VNIPISLCRRAFPWLAILVFVWGPRVCAENDPKNPDKDFASQRKAAEQGNATAQYNLGERYRLGHPEDVQRDAAEAAKWYRKAAEQGHAEAQCELAFLYQCGDGLPENAAEAAKWYRKAADQGNITAQIRLGIRYMGGNSPMYAAGVPRDEAEGLKWWRKAAAQGDAEAKNLLGSHYISKDLAEAMRWYRKAAEQGNTTGQTSLGNCYATGKDCFDGPKEAARYFREAAAQSKTSSQDRSGLSFEEAAKWYRKAAEQGDATGQYMLGLCCYYGLGQPKNLMESTKWYRKAADNHHPTAMILLAECYAKGLGVSLNSAEAIKWWGKAAKQSGGDDEKTLNCLIESWGIVTKGENSKAETFVGDCYANGNGVSKDYSEAIKWYRKAAERGYPDAQGKLGWSYYISRNGVPRNEAEAVKWFCKAAEQGEAKWQYILGSCYDKGDGVPKNSTEAVKWWRRGAEQGFKPAQTTLAACYRDGNGVVKDEVEAYKWGLILAGTGEAIDKLFSATLEENLTREQIAEGQKLARNFKPRKAPAAGVPVFGNQDADASPKASGTGFFITDGGFLITNKHVVEGANQVRLATNAGLIAAKVVKVDAANDFALLKCEGKFSALPVKTSRAVKLGASVATVGFPNIGMQGFAPKLAKGEIAALSGAADDARYFQISVPLQPGNSGGALVDERGNVVGVVSAKLDAAAALAASGALPENVNYAVKSSFLLGFLESVPDVASALREPNTNEDKFENVVKSAEHAAVLVLVY
jgi:TPR repeat protein